VVHVTGGRLVKQTALMAKVDSPPHSAPSSREHSSMLDSFP